MLYTYYKIDFNNIYYCIIQPNSCVYHIDSTSIMDDDLNYTTANIKEVDLSIKYQSYDFKAVTDISKATLLEKEYNDEQLFTGINAMKSHLNISKTQIDEFQIDVSVLLEKYGSSNLYNLYRSDAVKKETKKQIHKMIFYGKITTAINLIEFKYKIGNAFNVDNISNGCLKLTEILNCEKIFDINSIENNTFKHFGNAELPGNFIVAVNYYMKTNYPKINYYWNANSLMPGLTGPNTPGLPDQYGFYKNNKDRWLMGVDGMDGDITKIDNLRYIQAFFESNGKCDLYTSDAGIGLTLETFNMQELIEIKLKLAEVLCALVTLKNGGVMVIKFYTLFEKATVDLLLIVSQLFKTFKIVKPITSRPANSEVYIIGFGYIGYDKSVEYINLFYQKIEDFNNFGYIANVNSIDIIALTKVINHIYKKQILFINRNLYFFKRFYNSTSPLNDRTAIDIHNTFIKKTIEFYYDKYVFDNNLKPLKRNDNI